MKFKFFYIHSSRSLQTVELKNIGIFDGRKALLNKWKISWYGKNTVEDNESFVNYYVPDDQTGGG